MKMYIKYSTTFWIFWLTFVSIHHNHNQLKYTTAADAAAVKIEPQQKQQDKTAALSASTATTIKTATKKRQHQQQQWFPRGMTKDVIGDVVDIVDIVVDGKAQDNDKNVNKNVFGKAINVEQKKNPIKTSKLSLQELLKQHEAKLLKLNDTGGGGGVMDDFDDDDDENVSTEINNNNFRKFNQKPFKHKSIKNHNDDDNVKEENDFLIYGLKENIQNLLKLNNNIVNNKFVAQYNDEDDDDEYMATSSSTASTIKRSATMKHIETTTPATHPFVATPTTTPTTTSSSASSSSTTQQRRLLFPIPHSTPVERRHIIPEKLQYTKEIIIKQGRLMGIKRNFPPSAGIRAVDQYLGLPYAEAPVGSRRFMPPGAALPWQGLKMAHHLPPVCPQKLPDISLQGTAKMSKGRYKHLTRLLPYLKTESEDCLYLNVYVPSGDNNNAQTSSAAAAAAATFSATDTDEDDDDVGDDDDDAGSFIQKHLYPVVVYIHGESFEWNSGNAYDGSVLASYGEVIVVTVNYRIGILGFMRPSINENTVANFGLLDQIAALHWIKENIHSFGGDKNSVTLMGHTTGAACINYLMVSPVASGLFHRAILMSGSAMSDWAATNHSMQLTMQIAHGLNCPLNDDNEEMLSCLRQKRYQDILKIPTSLSQFSTSLGPIVDGHVIPNQPYKVMGQYTEHFSRYDLLFGITESESYHSLGALALDEGLRENERDNLLRFYMQSRFDVRPDLALAATLKKYSEMYNNPIKATNMEHRDVVLDILSDARVVGPLMQTGLFHAEVNRHNYMYVFGHNSFGGPHASLPHSIAGEELAFVFGAPLASAGLFHGTQYTAQEKLLAEAVMSYWCNFAKTGNPKAPWKGNFINLHALEWDRYDLEWPEFNKRSQAYMNIGIPPSVGYKYRQVYMNFWNKELPDELNQIAQIQQQPFLQATANNQHDYEDNVEEQRGAGGGGGGGERRHEGNILYGGTTAIYPKRFGARVDVITGHMNKFGTRDNGAEDPVRTLKLLLQEPYGKDTAAENMYNAPPSTQYKGIMAKGLGEDIDNARTQGSDMMFNSFTNNMAYTQRTPTTSLYGIRPYDAHTNGQEPGGDYAKQDNANANNHVNYVNEDNKSIGDLAADDNDNEANKQQQVAKSETTLHLLIGLIIVFIILNVIIYSTFLMQKKKKTKTLQRKLGAGILSYDGTTDDDLKRSKTCTQAEDNDDSFIMDTMRKSNTYEAIKTERSPINGFKITRQLSCSTVDTHTKVSEWITTTEPHKQATLLRRESSLKNSKKSSSFSSSLRGSGSFGKPTQPQKVSVAIDATPEGRGSSVSEQEPIEVTKLKMEGRGRIICQDVEVEDQDLLTPQDSLDNSRYNLMRQHSAVTEACDTELIQPLHQHSRSDPIDMYYTPEEKVTSFISIDDSEDLDINVTSKDDSDNTMLEALTPEQQLNEIKRRKYPKVLPSFKQHERETDSPPMTKDLTTTYKRNSLPPNSFFPHFYNKQQPPLPPPRTIATLGRKPSPGKRNSNNITTSPLMLAHDYTEEEEEPEITQNTLIVGTLKPCEGYYSTLKRKNKPANIDMQQQQHEQQINYHIPLQQPSVFQSFESQPPNYETPERDMPAHLTEKVYSIQAPYTNDGIRHQPNCCNSEPTTPVYQTPQTTPTALINETHTTLPSGVVYAQPKKSHIPRIQAINANLIHSNITAGGLTTTTSAATPPQTPNTILYNCKDTTNCCQIMPMVLDNNQVSSSETLQTPDVTTQTPVIENSSSSTATHTSAAAATTALAQSRIPQLHRNANVAGLIQQQQQQHPQYINKDKTNANIIPQATSTDILASPASNKQQTSVKTTPTTSSSSNVLSSSLTTPSSINCEIYDIPCSNKTASITSSCSSSASSASSRQSADSASSSNTTATSSSTGTVRTELQHKSN